MSPARKNDESDPRIQETLGVLISRGRRLLWRAAAQRLEARGESMHVHQVLGRLCRSGACTQRDLAEATAQHPAAVSRVLAELGRAGLVRRRRDRMDRRNVRVDVTPMGRARFEAARPRVTRAVEEVLAPLSSREQATLGRLLQKLLENR